MILESCRLAGELVSGILPSLELSKTSPKRTFLSLLSVSGLRLLGTTFTDITLGEKHAGPLRDRIGNFVALICLLTDKADTDIDCVHRDWSTSQKIDYLNSVRELCINGRIPKGSQDVTNEAVLAMSDTVFHESAFRNTQFKERTAKIIEVAKEQLTCTDANELLRLEAELGAQHGRLIVEVVEMFSGRDLSSFYNMAQNFGSFGQMLDGAIDLYRDYAEGAKTYGTLILQNSDYRLGNDIRQLYLFTANRYLLHAEQDRVHTVESRAKLTALAALVRFNCSFKLKRAAITDYKYWQEIAEAK